MRLILLPVCYLVFVLFLLPHIVMAQVTFNKRPGSQIGVLPKPVELNNVATLDNVEHVTGTLKVNIPLHTIKVNTITLPISVSYSALGLKLEQEPSPVGTGWSLNTGGKITRQLNGLPDEDPINGVINNPLPAANMDLSTPQQIEYVKSVVEGKKDAAWDVYDYSIPGGGGRYTTEGITFPYNPAVRISGKNIRTADGMWYQFTEGDVKSVTKRKFYTDDGYTEWILPKSSQWNNEAMIYTSDWNMSGMGSAFNNDAISFVYEEKNYNVEKIRSTETLPLDRDVFATSTLDLVFRDVNKSYIAGSPIITQAKIKTTTHKRLETINYPDGRLRFFYVNNSYIKTDILTNIYVQEKVDTGYITTKRIDFTIGSDPNAMRYYLNEIKIYDGNSVLINNWKFNYHYPASFTESDIKAQDYWGFFNGEGGNKTLLNIDSNLCLMGRQRAPILIDPLDNTFKKIRLRRREQYSEYLPGHIFDGDNPYPESSVENAYNTIEFGKRQYEFNYAVGGTLESITLPTGGKISYQYEPHKYRQKYVNWQGEYTLTKDGGGIRIKTITYTDSFSTEIRKREFRYGYGIEENDAFVESGWGNVVYPGNVLSYDKIFARANSSRTLKDLLLLSHPVNDMNLYNGSCAAYTTISEYNTIAGISEGKTVYFFSPTPQNFWSVTGYDTPLSIAVPNMHYNSGVITPLQLDYPNKVIEYKRTGTGVYTKVKETINTQEMFYRPEMSSPPKSYFAGLQSQLYGQLSDVITICQPTPKVDGQGTAYFDLECSSINGMTALDFTVFNSYTSEKNGRNPYYTGKYGTALVDLNNQSSCFRIKSTKTLIYPTDNGSNIFKDSTVYFYDNPAHLEPTKLLSINSNGDTVIQRTKYSGDYSSVSTGSGIGGLKSWGLLGTPIEKVSLVKKAGGVENIKAATLSTYRMVNGFAMPDKTYHLNLDGKSLPYSSFSAYNGESQQDNRYTTEMNVELYDNNRDIRQFSTTEGRSAYIRGYDGKYVIANVVNAAFQDIAYTSFETNAVGNWTVTGTARTKNDGVTGEQCYNLGSGTISCGGLTAARSYIVSYWAKTGASVTVSAAGTITNGSTINGWTYYEKKISNVTTLSISGTGSIDELRLYPENAQMISYTYKPMMGISSTQDATGKVSYYEYDAAGRLKLVRDQYGKILKQYDYKYLAPLQQ